MDTIRPVRDRPPTTASVVSEGGEAQLAELDDHSLREILDLTVPGADA